MHDSFVRTSRGKVLPESGRPPTTSGVLSALGRLFDEPRCEALKAPVAHQLTVFPLDALAHDGLFIKRLRVDLGDETTQSLSTSLGSHVRNLHRRLDSGRAVRSHLVSLDVMLDVRRIRRVDDAQANTLLGFEVPRRTGLWELHCGPARVFADAVTLIERLIAPDTKTLTLLLSPLLHHTYEVHVSEDEFRFGSNSATVADLSDPLDDEFPAKTYERARCLAYWLGSEGRSDALRAFLGQLLDPDARIAMPSMFVKVPFRLTCVVERGQYFVLQMDSMVLGGPWPMLFERITIEDRETGNAAQFTDRPGPPATLAWWGPQQVNVGSIGYKVIANAQYKRPGRKSDKPPPPSEGAFWPTTVRQGANKSVMLLDGRFCKGPARQGRLPFEQPICSLAPCGLPLDHSSRVLNLLESTPTHWEICARLKQLVPQLFGCLPVQLPRDALVREWGYARGRRGQVRLVRALVRFAGGRDWVSKFARQVGVEESSVLDWSKQIRRMPSEVDDFCAHADIAYLDPRSREEGWPPEMIDALRALGHRGTKAYGFSRNLWTDRQFAMLAQAAGFPPISELAAKLSSRRAAPFLSDAELRELLDLATVDER